MAALPDPPWDGEPVAGVTVSHGFTHFTLDLHIVRRSSPPDDDGWWQPLDRIDQAGLPTLYRRAVDAMLARRNDLAA